jgi:hypothetical protein
VLLSICTHSLDNAPDTWLSNHLYAEDLKYIHSSQQWGYIMRNGSLGNFIHPCVSIENHTYTNLDGIDQSFDMAF